MVDNENNPDCILKHYTSSCTDTVHDYLVSIINDDNKYHVFMEKMRSYQRMAGYTAELHDVMLRFMDELHKFSINTQARKNDIAKWFRMTMNLMEDMCTRSTLKRDFSLDFTK